MKSILLYANADSGMEARLQAALDIARLFGGHVTLLQVTPYDAYIMTDPLGGVYALPTVVGEVARREEEFRSEIEARLAGEDVAWSWDHGEGGAADLLVERGGLADLIVVNLPTEDSAAKLSLAAGVALHARAPVLAVREASRGLDALGNAVVAWNGALEAAHALRLALPMLQRAATVHVVTVAEEKVDVPAADAAEYLSRHGVVPLVHQWPRDGRSTADALIDAARSLGAGYVAMGAYGHSRLRQAVLGGATREMLHRSPLPLLLGH